MRCVEWLRTDVLRLAQTDAFRWFLEKKDNASIAWRRSRSRKLSVIPARQGADFVLPYRPARAYDHQKPMITGGPAFIRGRLDECFANNPVHAPAGGIALFRDAVVLSKGCIMTAGGQLIEESLTNTKLVVDFWPLRKASEDADPELSIGRRFIMNRLGDAIYVLIKQSYDENYGHWLIEGLPRAGALLNTFGADKLKFIVSSNDGPMKNVYFASLTALGVDARSIVELDDKPYHFERLLYPFPMTSHHEFKTNPFSIDVLEKISHRYARATIPDKKIYVSRNKFGRRKLINEDEIIEICASYGLATVYPETINFEDQVSLFAESIFIVGNCGAALSNIVFSPRGATLLALTSEHMHDAFYWDLASVKDIKYISLHGTSVGTPQTDDYMDSANLDFQIDCGKFKAMLSSALRDSHLV